LIINTKAYDHASKEKCTEVVNNNLESENIFVSTFSTQLKLILLSFHTFHGSKVFNLEKETRENIS